MTASHRLAAATPRKPRNRQAGLTRLVRCAALALALLLPPNPAPAAITDDAVLRRMDTVLEENARLRDDAWKARSHGRDAAKQAQDALEASEARVEKTRAEALAHVAGVPQSQVESLRRDGRSWGQAAEELGVHPGFLGIGKTPLYESLPRAKAKPKAKSRAKDKDKGKDKGKTKDKRSASRAKADDAKEKKIKKTKTPAKGPADSGNTAKKKKKPKKKD